MKAASKTLVPVLITAYRTGMRRGEIINLTWDQVDLKEGFIYLEPENTKTSEARVVPMHAEVIAALSALPRAIHHDRVFTKADGSPIKSVRKAFESARKRAGLEDLWFHDLRHTAATNWRREGHDYFKIMAATGHKTISSFKRYNTVDKTDLKTLVSPPMDTYMDTKPTFETAVKKRGSGLST